MLFRRSTNREVKNPILNLSILSEGISKRLGWIDFAKGIAIIAVVYRHILFGLEGAGLKYPAIFTDASIMIESIRMPLFFILSGVFVRRSLAKKSGKAFALGRLESLMYPYLVWTVIQITIQIAFSNFANSSRGVKDYLYIFYQPRAIDHFWFFYALFAVSIFYLIVYKLSEGNKLILSAVGLFLYFIYPLIHINVIEDVCRYLVFFVMGDLLAIYISNPENKKQIASIYVTVFFFLFFAIGQWYIFNTLDTGHLLLAIVSLAGSFLTINVGFMIGDKPWLKFIRIIGFHSMYIYILHVLVAGFTRAILMRVLYITDPYVILVIVTLASVLVPIVFYHLTKKKAYFLFTLKKPKS